MESHGICKMYPSHIPKQPSVLFDPIRNVLVTSDTFNQFSSLPLSIAINNSVRRLRLSRQYSKRVSSGNDVQQHNNNGQLQQILFSSERKRRNTVDNSSVAYYPQFENIVQRDATCGGANNSSGASKSRKSTDKPMRSMSLCVRKCHPQHREIPRIPAKVKHVLTCTHYISQD